jgi:hypothetical protein
MVSGTALLCAEALSRHQTQWTVVRRVSISRKATITRKAVIMSISLGGVHPA